jgi:hypothetical protein
MLKITGLACLSLHLKHSQLCKHGTAPLFIEGQRIVIQRLNYFSCALTIVFLASDSTKAHRKNGQSPALRSVELGLRSPTDLFLMI